MRNDMGAFEAVKGAVKEKVGDATGHDDLSNEGQAQKEKGEAQTTAEKERALAQKDEEEADQLEKSAPDA